MKTIKVVAAIICDDVKEKNKIFATARGYGDFKGGWEFPGGKVEPGETPQQALVREIMEELNTEIKDYIYKVVFGYSGRNILDEDKQIKTSELDEWGEQFLDVLFGGKTIKSFNTGMFLESLAGEQEDDYHGLVCLRWNVIQDYYLGKVDEAIKTLEDALRLAKEQTKPSWLIQDILIDLRNLHWVSNTEHNCFSESEAQKELDKFEEELYYPSLDRIHNSLQERYGLWAVFDSKS